MTSPRRALAAALVAAALCGACRFHHGHFAMISDFPIQAVDLDAEELAAAPEVQGGSYRNVWVLWPADEQPTVEDALQAALLRTDADALVDVTVEHEVFWIPLIYGYSGYRVTGRAVHVLQAPGRDRNRRSRLLQGR